jgi:hypothetical protein
MNSSTDMKLVQCPNNNSINYIFNKYPENIVNLFGLVANSLCVIIFIRIVINKRITHSQGKMYEYFLIKSILDFFFFCSNTFEYLYFCKTCEASSSYLIQIWYIWFYSYFESICSTCSFFLEIAATFDCYITINSKCKCCQTNSFFYSFCVLILCFSFIIYLTFPLGFVIKHTIKIDPVLNKTFYFYYRDFNDFGDTQLFENIHFMNSIVKDGIFLVILVTLNVMILVTLQRTTQRRRVLKGNRNLLTTSQKAENKKVIMIIATGFNYLIGHFSYFILVVLYKFYDASIFCYSQYFFFLYYITFADNIFFYFFFNNIFKRFFFQLFPFYNANS